MSRKYEEINATLAYLFHKATIENPELLDKLPENSVVVMQIEGYEAFNKWARRISLKQPREKDQQVVYAVFKLSPQLPPRRITSRRIAAAKVEELELQPA
jgi:hypothetical protein